MLLMLVVLSVLRVLIGQHELGHHWSVMSGVSQSSVGLDRYDSSYCDHSGVDFYMDCDS